MRHDLVSRSDTIRYVSRGLSRLSTIGARSYKIITIGNWYVQIHSYTFRYAHQEPMSSVAIGYDGVRDDFHDWDRE